MSQNTIDGLSVYASGVYRLEISKGKKILESNRVPVSAQVDKETGEVKFFIDTKNIKKLE